MTGSNPFSIEESDSFRRSFKKLAKIHKTKFVGLIASVLEELLDDPYPLKSRREPLPGKIQLPESWTFHKLEIPFAKGASGQIRLMYLVNPNEQVIRLVWIYSHEQFAKRPTDPDLTRVIEEILGD